MSRKLLSIVLLTTMLSACTQGEQNGGGLPWWGWLLLILVLGLIAWLLFRKRPAEKIESVSRTVEFEAAAPEEPVEPGSLQPVMEDDLKLIEGIGPKIESVLKAAGVHSFSQLAGMDAESIGGILSDGGIRLAFPESWPDQARLVVEGEMEALKSLQDELQAGR